MPATDLNDLIEPTVFSQYVSEFSTKKNRLYQSNVIMQTEEMNERASQKSNLVNIPFFKPLSRGDLDGGFASQVHQTNTNINLEKIDAGKIQALKHRRSHAWGAEDLAGTITGSDPMRNIAQKVAGFWDHEVQLAVLMVLRALFKASGPLGANQDDPHILDVATEDGTAENDVKIQAKHFIQATAMIGDAWPQITTIAAHSHTVKTMREQDILDDTVQKSEQEDGFDSYQGREILEDDSLPVEVGQDADNAHDIYWTFLLGEGAFAYGEGSPKTPTETQRQARENGGQDELVNRKHFIAHPNGLSYTDTISGDTPTQSELETAGDWSLEYGHKNVPIVAIRHN